MTVGTNDSISLEYVGTLPDDTVFDTPRQDMAETEGPAKTQPDRDYEPLAVEVGAGAVIKGLDETLAGMSVGDEKSIEVPPEKTYSEYDKDLVREHETEQLHEMLGDEPEEGLYVQTQQGGFGEVAHTNDNVIHIDLNHELTGETPIFSVEILDAN